MKAMQQNASSTRFFIRDCRWVSEITSPKQPQSIGGLYMASRAVTTVKKPHSAKVAIAMNFLSTPLIRDIPRKVSDRARTIAIGIAAHLRKLK